MLIWCGMQCVVVAVHCVIASGERATYTFCMYICLIEYTVLASVCVSHGRVGS